MACGVLARPRAARYRWAMTLSRLCLTLVFCCLASLATASCGGSDLRATLSDAERAEIDARLARTPYATGTAWRATRGAQELYLIGTMHLDDPRFDSVMQGLAPVIRRAELVLLEATAEEEAKLEAAVSARPELLFLTSGPTLPELMPEDEWDALAEAARSRGLPAFMAAKMQPWYLSVFLTMPACAVEQMQQGMSGLDARIMAFAARAGVPQRPLEPYDTLFTLMAEEPLEEQVRMLTLGVLPEAVAEDAFFTLKASYFEQKSAEVLEVNRIVAHRHVDLPRAEIDALLDEMLDTLLVRRNRAWMTPILGAPDGVTVVAMGAAHLPGEAGVLALLEAEGFALERLEF